MKISEAKKIIGDIQDWQFVMMGIKDRENLKDTKYLSELTLEQILRANKLVDLDNERRRRRQQERVKSGKKSKGISIHMTCADRLIAGVYFALHYASDGEMKVIVNDKGAGIVDVNYEE